MHQSFRDGFEKKSDTATASVSDAGIGASLLDPTRGPRKPVKDPLSDDKHYEQNQATR